MLYLPCCPTDTQQREEVSSLSEIIISFLVSFTAGIACHYAIKWLDGDKQGNTSLAVACLL